MVDFDSVRRIALALPGTSESATDHRPDRLWFFVGDKSFAWTYLERVGPKQPRRVRPDVLAVRCPLERKELLLEAAPEVFFDDDHYRGFAGILMRLEAVEEDQLASLLEEAWRMRASKTLLKAADAAQKRSVAQ